MKTELSLSCACSPRRARCLTLGAVRKCSGALQALALTVLLGGAALPARAQLLLTLPTDPIVLTGTSGGTVVFAATLTNNYAFALYLNSDAFTIDSPATLDDTRFQETFVTPISGPQPTLAANGGTLTVNLFDVTLPGGTPPGLYTGTLTLQGGSGPLDANTLVTGQFAVRQAGPSTVPESGGTVVGAAFLGLSGGLLWARRLRRRRAL